MKGGTVYFGVTFFCVVCGAGLVRIGKAVTIISTAEKSVR